MEWWVGLFVLHKGVLVFFTGMVLMSVNVRLFHSFRRISPSISAAPHLIHGSEFSCTNTVHTELKKSIIMETLAAATWVSGLERP